MANNTRKISELSSKGIVPESALLPVAVAGAEKETYRTTLNNLRANLLFENAYETLAEGIAATVKDEIFYVYTDESQFYVAAFTNVNGASATALYKDNTPVIYGTGKMMADGKFGSYTSYVSYLYNNGSANGGETEIALPFDCFDVSEMFLNGGHQFKGLNYTFDRLSNKVKLKGPLTAGAFVVFYVRPYPGTPVTPVEPGITDYVNVTWLYNDGAAVGGETSLTPPWTFKTIPAIYINGSKQVLNKHYEVDSTGLKINLSKALNTNDIVEVLLGGSRSVITAQVSGTPAEILLTLGQTTGATKVNTSYGVSLEQVVQGFYGVSSFDDLRNRRPNFEGEKVNLRGYYTTSTSGSGEFVGHIGTATDDGGTIAAGNGFYWQRVFTGNRLKIDWFGADPSGSVYSSDAIRNTLKVSNYIEMQGTYKFSGASIDKGSFDIKGNGSTIILDAGTTLFTCSGTIYRPYAENLYLTGGESYFDFRAATANTYTDIRGFRNLNMQGYTGTAIRLPGIDCPWWIIENCVFAGATNVGTIGLWDNGSDNNIIRGNKFYKNQYHLSTNPGSGTLLIEANDFGQFNTTGDGVDRANIWVRVPTTTPTFTGITGMFLVSDNKFGNENETSRDVKLLMANAGSDSFPLYGSYSGSLRSTHFIFSRNYYTGTGAYPAYWMRSVGGWLPTTFSLEDENLQYADYFKSKYFCYMDNVTRTTPFRFYTRGKAFRDSNLLWRGICSNDPMVSFSLIDPSLDVRAGDPLAHSPYSAGIGSGVTDITKNILPNITYAGTVTYTAGTDSIDGKEAITATFTGRYGNIFQPIKTVAVAQPGYIQGELKLADDATFNRAIYVLYYSATTANQLVYAQFPVELVKGAWTSYCFPVMLVPNVSTHVIVLGPNTQDTTSYPNKVIWSRNRVSMGRTPGLLGVQQVGSLKLTEVPTSATGLVTGQIWCDVANGNVLKIV